MLGASDAPPDTSRWSFSGGWPAWCGYSARVPRSGPHTANWPRHNRCLAKALRQKFPAKPAQTHTALANRSRCKARRARCAYYENCDPLGVSVSLDDFGTGFSSFRYLKDFPITALKIEQSFVQSMITEPKDRAVIKTLVDVTKYCDISLVAKGVETRDQLECLQGMGCCHVQGYYFSRLVPADQFVAYVKSAPLFPG